MIINAIIRLILGIALAPTSILSKFLDMTASPEMYFDWVSDIAPYFECIRYIIPLDSPYMIALFVAIITVTAIRIIVALVKLFVGKIVPVW